MRACGVHLIKDYKLTIITTITNTANTTNTTITIIINTL